MTRYTASDKLTNFPKSGDNQEITLRNSNYPQFDYSYALDLKENWPEIWSKGGNDYGNEAFEFWGKARKGSDSDGVKRWIKKREAWAARHYGNKNLPGVVAWIKWGVIGQHGVSKMKSIISEEKKRLQSRSKKALIKEGFIEMSSKVAIYRYEFLTREDAHVFQQKVFKQKDPKLESYFMEKGVSDLHSQLGNQLGILKSFVDRAFEDNSKDLNLSALKRSLDSRVSQYNSVTLNSYPSILESALKSYEEVEYQLSLVADSNDLDMVVDQIQDLIKILNKNIVAWKNMLKNYSKAAFHFKTSSDYVYNPHRDYLDEMAKDPKALAEFINNYTSLHESPRTGLQDGYYYEVRFPDFEDVEDEYYDQVQEEEDELYDLYYKAVGNRNISDFFLVTEDFVKKYIDKTASRRIFKSSASPNSILRDIWALSSGTLATLIKQVGILDTEDRVTGKMTDLLQESFGTWTEENIENENYSNWHDAWRDYQNSMESELVSDEIQDIAFSKYSRRKRSFLTQNKLRLSARTQGIDFTVQHIQTLKNHVHPTQREYVDQLEEIYQEIKPALQGSSFEDFNLLEDTVTELEDIRYDLEGSEYEGPGPNALMSVVQKMLDSISMKSKELKQVFKLKNSRR